MKQSPCSLTFIVSGLLDPVPYLEQLPAQDLPEIPVFSKMLSRGEFSTPESLDDSDNNFYHCMQHELSSSEAIDDVFSQSSIAGLSCAFDIKNLSEAERLNSGVSFNDSTAQKWVMRADPSFMAVDRDQLVLAQTSSLDLSISEAKTLADEINQFFNDFEEEKFWTLKALSADRWYIISDKPIRIQSVPPENVLGQFVKSFLFNKEVSDKGELTGNEDSSHWLNLFNEFQMILHQSEVNKKRAEEKKIPVNSLWFWGSGKAIDCSALSSPYSETMIYSDNFFVQSLSQLSNKKCSALPEKYIPETYVSRKCEQPNSGKTVQQIIYTIDDFNQAIRNKDIFSWIGLLEQFEHNYLVPLIKELDAGQIVQLEFVSPSGTRLLVTKKLLKRWWRKKHKYYSFLSAK